MEDEGMADEKKQGFFSKYFAAKHSSCCDMKIEEVTEEASADAKAQGTATASQEAGEGKPKTASKARRQASSCCGGNSDPKSGGGCCG